MLEQGLAPGISGSDNTQSEFRQIKQEEYRQLDLQIPAVLLSGQPVHHNQEQHHCREKRRGIHASRQQKLQRQKGCHSPDRNLSPAQGICQHAKQNQHDREQPRIAHASIPPVKGFYSERHILDAERHNHTGCHRCHRFGQSQQTVQHHLAEIPESDCKYSQQNKGLYKRNPLCDNRGTQSRDDGKRIGSLPAVPQIHGPLHGSLQHGGNYCQSLILQQRVPCQNSIVKIVHSRMVEKTQNQQRDQTDDKTYQNKTQLVFLFLHPAYESPPELSGNSINGFQNVLLTLTFTPAPALLLFLFLSYSYFSFVPVFSFCSSTRSFSSRASS